MAPCISLLLNILNIHTEDIGNLLLDESVALGGIGNRNHLSRAFNFTVGLFLGF